MMTQYSIDLPDKEVFGLLTDKNHYQMRKKLNDSILQLLNICLSNIQNNNVLADSHLPNSIKTFSPKISKGENYIGFPWMILDYPRLFSKSNILAIRTLCWYGNSMSITMHLSGESLDKYRSSLLKRLSILYGKEYFISKDSDEWDHRINSYNYISLDELIETPNFLLEQENFKKYLKLTKQISFDEWSKIPKIHYETTCLYLELLK